MTPAVTDSGQKFHHQKAVFLSSSTPASLHPLFHPLSSVASEKRSLTVLAHLYFFDSFFSFLKNNTYFAMAEAVQQQAPPTFKLVLVGDGGTGKASEFSGEEFRWTLEDSIFCLVDTNWTGILFCFSMLISSPFRLRQQKICLPEWAVDSVGSYC